MIKLFLNRFILIFFICVFSISVVAQGPLERDVNIHADRQQLKAVLTLLEKQANCTFSYESTLFNPDSIVSVHANQLTLKEVLRLLFNDKYSPEENNNYVVIYRRLPGLTILNPDITEGRQFWSFSGFVVDDRTGERIMNASVYEKRLLQSTLTDGHGYFRIRFKSRNEHLIQLTLAKLNYRDTTINMLATVPINTRMASDKHLYREEQKNVEKTGLGAFLVSSRQRVQSLNIRNFFAYSPFQVSLTPGLSTHGLLSSQIVNKFSLNVAGGYTAGVDGFEIGGLFNVNKKDSKYLQLSGVFNLTGGRMTGLQASAVHNMVLDTATGVQIAGFINHTEGPVRGIQVAAIHNYARKLQGLQIGLVNQVDTSEGVSIGLINIVRNGHYRISFSANDAMNTNFSFQTGTSRFYSAIKAGLNINPSEKMYAFGMGIGREFFPRRMFSLVTEFNYMITNTDGTWDGRWVRFEPSLNMKLGNGVEVFAGPVFNRYRQSGSYSREGYKNLAHAPAYDEPEGGYWGKPPFIGAYPERNWIGWQGGIAFRSPFKPLVRPASLLPDRNRRWSMNIGLSGGAADYPYGFVSGADVRLMRHLGGNIDAIFTAGFIHLHAPYTSPTYDWMFVTPDKVYNVTIKRKSFKGVPLKGGVRAMLGRAFYVAGEVGIGFSNAKTTILNKEEIPPGVVDLVNNLGPGNTSFIYSPSLGFAFRRGLDLALRFEDFTNCPAGKYLAVRLAYGFNISE